MRSSNLTRGLIGLLIVLAVVTSAWVWKVRGDQAPVRGVLGDLRAEGLAKRLEAYDRLDRLLDWNTSRPRPDPRPAIPILVEALSDPDVRVRRSAAHCLSRIEPEAPSATRSLRTSMRDTDVDVRFWAARAIILLDPKDPTVLTTLKREFPRLLRDLRPTNRMDPVAEASQVLYRMGPAAVPLLIEVVERVDPTKRNGGVRRSVIEILGRMGTPGLAAIPVLTKALQDQDEYIRTSAAIALGNLGPAAGEAAPALGASLEDPVPAVREFAIVSLERMGPAAKTAVPALKKCLDHEWDYPTSPQFREAVSRTLRKLR